MKKFSPFTFLLLLSASLNAQLLSWTPDFIQESSTPVDITMDATFGNNGLLNYTPTSDVYVHIGVITNKSISTTDWKHSKFTWGTTDPLAQCVYLGNNKWKYTITGGLRTYFNVTDVTETIQKIAILFRNGAGTSVQRNKNYSDMYVPVYDNGLYARIDVPLIQPLYDPLPEPINKKVGDALTVTAKASQSSTMKIYLNGVVVGSGSGTSLTATPTITTAGNEQIIAEATNGTTSRDTISFGVSKVQDLPPGTNDGINYEAGDTSATLVLYAPGKSNVYVVGDFNNWTSSANYLMNITSDSKRFWTRLTHLTSGTEYAYQFLIDGSLKVADFNTEKILDPDNDPYILPSTYPNLKPYPTGKTTGIVSVLQTAKPTYTWQVNNFAKPDKRNLLIYELLVRDFVANHDWQTLKDTLSYLKRLGINAIEVMPFNEFDGNISWGYGPDFYFAPDKYYGTETALKQFIDECHKKGMAVIMDMAMNGSLYTSPMVQMYWDAANNRPAPDNPWYNTVPKHAFNVGYDFNHESTATNDLVNRVINHWLVDFKIDGFRWDLSKGYTQKQTCDNNGENCDVAAWSAYDASRIAIWKKYYGYMKAASPNSYCILEHLSDNTEEKELSDNGMMPWGNLNYSYNQATKGVNTGSDFSWGIYTARGWSNPYLVTYQESHDEERLMYRNITEGNSILGYNVKDTAIGLKRNGMATAFWSMQPGPKMMWQFGELGYDYTINRCEDGSISTNCRTSPKPIRWDYYSNTNRKALYDVYAGLFKLRNTPNYISTFTTGTITYNLSSAVKWQNLVDDSLKIVVFGNFDVAVQTANVTFPSTGIWYSYFTDSVKNVASTNLFITLKPGEYYVFTNKNVRQSVLLPVSWLSFTAQKATNNSVQLNWSTANEINNNHFEVQRSVNGISFTTITSIAAANNGNNVQRYQYTDILPLKGINYYRIKQVDNDGRYSYSAVEKINMDAVAKLLKLYPNPAVNETAIYTLAELNQFVYTITDLSGKLLYHSNTTNVSANQRIEIPVQNLTKGVYMLKINSDKGADVEKLIIE